MLAVNAGGQCYRRDRCLPFKRPGLPVACAPSRTLVCSKVRRRTINPITVKKTAIANMMKAGRPLCTTNAAPACNAHKNASTIQISHKRIQL